MNNNLLKALAILKIGRVALIEDITLQRRHDILRVAFKYENDLRVLSTIFHQYFIEWLNGQIIASFKESPDLGVFLVNLLSSALEERLSIRKEDLINIDKMLPSLFADKIEILKSFMAIEDVNEKRLNQLNYAIERDNALFKRLLNQMEGNNNGSS